MKRINCSKGTTRPSPQHKAHGLAAFAGVSGKAFQGSPARPPSRTFPGKASRPLSPARGPRATPKLNHIHTLQLARAAWSQTQPEPCTHCRRQVHLFEIGGIQSGHRLKKTRGLEPPPNPNWHRSSLDKSRLNLNKHKHPEARDGPNRASAWSRQVPGQGRCVQSRNKKTGARSEFEGSAPAGVGSCRSRCAPGCFQLQRTPSLRHLKPQTLNLTPLSPKPNPRDKAHSRLQAGCADGIGQGFQPAPQAV